ncbi:MAG: hypothetical protein KJ709_04460 [Nanoarchaeota archaeon]|nr:hypothetical protein [Nanoarchaeota archaeon]
MMTRDEMEQGSRGDNTTEDVHVVDRDISRVLGEKMTQKSIPQEELMGKEIAILAGEPYLIEKTPGLGRPADVNRIIYIHEGQAFLEPCNNLSPEYLAAIQQERGALDEHKIDFLVGAKGKRPQE